MLDVTKNIFYWLLKVFAWNFQWNWKNTSNQPHKIVQIFMSHPLHCNFKWYLFQTGNKLLTDIQIWIYFCFLHFKEIKVYYIACVNIFFFLFLWNVWDTVDYLLTTTGVKSNDFVISRLPTEVSKETFGNNYVNPFTLKFFLLEHPFPCFDRPPKNCL